MQMHSRNRVRVAGASQRGGDGEMLDQIESSPFDNSKTLYFCIDLPDHITMMLSAKYNMTMIYNGPVDNFQNESSGTDSKNCEEPKK